MNNAKSLLSIVALFLAACSPQNASQVSMQNAGSSGLMNAEAADMTSFEARSVVQILDRKKSAVCTGTLIDTNIVLTAAHCATGSAADMEIDFDIAEYRPQFSRVVTAVERHDKYNLKEAEGGTVTLNQERGDIALLRFEGALPMGYGPISLPEKSDQWLTGVEFLALGYGRTGINQNSSPVLLNKKLKTKVLSARQFEFTVDQRQSGGVCPGDSGGPAMLMKNNRLLVIGVASAITYPQNIRQDAELCQFDSVYTNVVFYRGWIDQKLQLLKQK